MYHTQHWVDQLDVNIKSSDTQIRIGRGSSTLTKTNCAGKSRKKKNRHGVCDCLVLHYCGVFSLLLSRYCCLLSAPTIIFSRQVCVCVVYGCVC